jgi:DNA-binding transcriptional MerR regulator
VDKAPDAFRTISEVAEELNVPQHVLRFWETRFREIKPLKRGGGRRYYRPDDIGLLRGIHHLLYGEGYTIRGVQRILRDQGVRFVQTVWQPGAPQPVHRASEDVADVSDDVAEATAEAGDGSEPRLPTSLIPPSGGDAPDRAGRPEPRAVMPARPIAPSPAAPPRGLPPESVQRLTAALHELDECRKLLAATVNERS